ncbi:leukotriene B4 receptor 1-like [Misgurnus anguillicaudatus]|uniref:leukotriene B4 receptor 1-like n=1 Tax=Misgurnus anguillicaudatus TaxID=75329 RepID=UPI003CCFAEC3
MWHQTKVSFLKVLPYPSLSRPQLHIHISSCEMTMENMNVSNSSHVGHTSVGMLVSSSILGMCCVLGVPGNVAVLVMLARNLKEGSITPKLMMSLAVSDLLSLISLPVWIYSLLYGWIFGHGLCKFLSYLVYWSLYSSVLCITLMSVQRYIQVLYPQRWAKLGRSGHNGLICGIWTLGSLFASYALVYRTVKKTNENLVLCSPSFRDNQEKIAILLLETVVLFFVPFLSLLCFYLRLYQRIRQSSFSINKFSKMVVRIIVTFFIFSTPCMIINVVQMAVTKELEDGTNVLGALFFINSCVNPFLYAFPAGTPPCRTRQHSSDQALTDTTE